MFGPLGTLLTRSSRVFSTLLFTEQGGKTAAGPQVTEESAMQVGLFYRCLQIKAETLAALACILYRVTEKDGTPILEAALRHPVYQVLLHKPNEMDSPQEFFVQMCLDLDLWGNWYAKPEYHPNGKLKALWRIPPECVEPRWVSFPMKAVYEYTPPSPDGATSPGGTELLMPGEIVHIKALPTTQARSNYGLEGVGLLATQRETIGLAIASRNYASDMLRNKAVPAGILKYKGNLSKKDRDEAAQQWDDRHGAGKRGKTAVLQASVDYQPLAMSAVDMQLFESRMMSNADICTITGVPGFLVGVKSDTTYSNTREQIRAFHSVTIGQLAHRIAKGLEKGLIPAGQRARFEIRFQLSDMTRGDDLARAKWFETMVRIGAFSPNDVLAMEGRNPRAGGDVYTLLPGAAEQTPGEKAPAPPDSEEPPEEPPEEPGADSNG